MYNFRKFRSHKSYKDGSYSGTVYKNGKYRRESDIIYNEPFMSLLTLNCKYKKRIEFNSLAISYENHMCDVNGKLGMNSYEISHNKIVSIYYDIYAIYENDELNIGKFN